MNEIEINKHQTYQYKDLKIGICRIANRKLIRRLLATIYFGDRQSLRDRGQEIYKKLKYLYLLNCSFQFF